MCLVRAFAVLSASCLVLSAGAGAAENPAGLLTLHAALDRAVRHQPALAGFEFDMRALDARIVEAALRPAPEGEFLLEDALGTGERSGVKSAQTTLGLSQLVELGGKREGRIAVAEATRTRMKSEQAARQLDVLAEVTRCFLEVLKWQARAETSAEGVAIAQRTLDAVRLRVAAARAPEAEALRAEVNLVEAELDVADSEHELAAARRFLAAAMGDTEIRFGQATGELLALPPTEDFNVLLSRVDASPGFLRFADEARFRDAELRLAEMRRRPDMRFSVGARRYEQGDDVALVAGITVPLYSARRAAAHIDVMKAQRDRLGPERATAFLKVQAQLFDQFQAMGHARHEAGLLREQIIPRLEKALVQTEYAYQQGRYSLLELTSAQRELLDARRRHVDVATDFHALRTEVERLTGEGLAPSGESQ